MYFYEGVVMHFQKGKGTLENGQNIYFFIKRFWGAEHFETYGDINIDPPLMYVNHQEKLQY